MFEDTAYDAVFTAVDLDTNLIFLFQVSQLIYFSHPVFQFQSAKNLLKIIRCNIFIQCYLVDLAVLIFRMR
ncbi:hypothetical protein D3C86_1864720 [compost metagenome]